MLATNDQKLATVLVLCDAINSGKSTFCLHLAKELINHECDVSGFVTPPYTIDGKKHGHDFIAIDHGKMAPPIPFTREEAFSGSFPMFRYHFNSRAFEIAEGLSGEIFVLDEIGPLELDHRRGFYDIFKRVTKAAKVALVIVRDGLKDQFVKNLAPKNSFFYTLAETQALKSCFPGKSRL